MDSLAQPDLKQFQRTALKSDCPPGLLASEEDLLGISRHFGEIFMPDTCQDPSGIGCTEPLKKSSGNSACLMPTQFPFVPIGTLSFSSPTSHQKGSVCYATNQRSRISVPQSGVMLVSWMKGKRVAVTHVRSHKHRKKNPLNCYHKQHFHTENPYTAHTGRTYI